MADNEGSSEQDDVSFLRTEDMVCLSCNATGERVCLAAEGFGNRTCFLETIADKNNPPDLSQCVFVIEQALSVRALQELVTAAANESQDGDGAGKGTGSGHRTLLYGNAVLLHHQNSNMYLACLSTSSSKDKLAFDVGLQEHSQGESCWWTIHPASKQRSEGEKVRVGDDLILVSVATERYLQATKEDDQSIVNASFHVTHWSVAPFGTGLSRLKFVACVFGGEVLRFFHGGDECLSIPSTWSDQPGQNIVVYEGGSVTSQARSLWRLELARTKWAGGYINWFHPMRLRHITTGRYLGINQQHELVLLERSEATLAATAFYLREEKDDNKVILEDKDLEVIGTALIKYGDSTVIVQHIETGLWLSYRAFEIKKKGVGKVEVKQAILHEEGKMDDGLQFYRSQEEESRTARVIRKCSDLFNNFIKCLDDMQSSRRHSVLLRSVSLKEIINCLEDLINYFAYPSDELVHEERQVCLRALRNRQDLFQEEGILILILDAIDKITIIASQGYLVALVGEESGQDWEIISGYLYQLLAAVIKGNHTNCSIFANSHRLNWLFSRLGSAGEGTGMLDVLHCVLIDSPEALNVMKEEHIKVIIALLEKYGRDPKVLDVLCSLCVGNGTAVRSSQNNICDYLLPGRNLLLQTQLVDHVSSVRPNIFVGHVEGSAMYQKYYFEVTLDHIEQVSHLPPHLRIGWANTCGYVPYPGGGEKWGGNGVGDDLYSFGFDGCNLWTGGRETAVNPLSSTPYIKKGDVIGCALDLTVPVITFYVNGRQVNGAFTGFNLDGMFFPVISASAKLSARFLLGGEHGRLKYPPPEAHSPVSECLLPYQTLSIDPCFYFGEVHKSTVAGPLLVEDDVAFVPHPLDTSNIILPGFIEQVRDKLAENIHEMWAMNKIEQGWCYGDRRDDLRLLHPCLTSFEQLPVSEKRYDATLALQTLKTILALGYHVSMDKPPSRIRSVRLPNDPFLQTNGYKPAPLDLSQVSLTSKLEELVELLAENTHNIWARERILQGWTYGLNEDPDLRRSPHLVTYSHVDDIIKKANRDTASETVRTLLVYGYILEPPSGEATEGAEDQKKGGKRVEYRTYRLEKTNAVSSGKWYFEMEVLTAGPMRVGWAATNCPPGNELGADDRSWAFDGHFHMKSHAGVYEVYGQRVRVGDVVGVMLDLHDWSISFSLNGELMMDASGSETAFSDVQGDAFVPACTLGVGQKAKFAFGQDITQLKYFTTYGLQEGYEPFCVNMEKAVTFWYTKDQPTFENNDDLADSTVEVTRIPAGSDTPPCLKISSKMFEACEKANWEFLRMSLPVVCSSEFIDEEEKERRWNTVRIRQHRIVPSEAVQTVVAQPDMHSSMLDSGFSMSDIKDLHRSYPEEGVEADEMLSTSGKGEPTSGTPATKRSKLSKTGSFDVGDGGADGEPGKMPKASSELNIVGKGKAPDSGERKKRGKSPFRFFKKRDQSGEGRSKGRVTETGTLDVPGGKNRQASVRLAGAADNKLIPPAIPERQGDGQQGQLFDAECLKLINEYFYGVRIFPGQDPAHVYIGWVTTQYHIHDTNFDQSKVRSVIVQEYTEDGDVKSAIERHSCYMFRADELFSEVTSDASGKGSSQGMFIGCFIDTSTGFISLQCEGKATRHKYRMEPGIKLFPAVFVEPTSKEVLQIELGRTQTTLPLSAAVLQNSEKHVVPQMPPRLRLQILQPNEWCRVPNTSLRIHALKLSDIRGWSMLAEDSVPMLALNIPEEDRSIDILELIENEKLLNFHAYTLALYCAVCFQSNYRAAHTLCHHVGQNQLLYAIQCPYMSGPLRMGFYNLLIALHLESFASTMEVTQNEFIVPLSNDLKDLYSDPSMGNSMSATQTESVRPIMVMSEIQENIETIKGLSSPDFPLDEVREFVMQALSDAVKSNQVANRDPIGGSNENFFVPLLKLVDNLLLVGCMQDDDLCKLLVMIDPETWDPNFDKEGADENRKGLLNMEIAEGVKLQLCCVLHHLIDLQLRHRVENIITYAQDYVGEIQADQLRRYIEIKQSDLPSAVAAKKTKEFRCPPREQMNAILAFKNLSEEELEEAPCGEDLKSKLLAFHAHLMEKAKIPGGKEEEGDNEDATKAEPKGILSRMLGFLKAAKEEEVAAIEEAAESTDPADKFKKVLVNTIVRWASESFIENPILIREMFSLLLRQYNAVGELMLALEKTYAISSMTKRDVTFMWQCLSKIRALLPVQMSQEEEELMRQLLWRLVNNHIFFQHPDLIRILRVHENVMAVMMNTLGRRAQAQNETQVAEGAAAAAEAVGLPKEKEKDTSHEMVVACCKFLCYFCRTSRQNQKAMFDHLPFLLENSNILLSRPSLQGTTPLDVAYSSLMDNTELALALREHHLEKIAVYLSRCGLQSNSELVEKGYPDLGWDPVEGERYLDFLRFCVWVGGESVEENANLVIRLLIRKPECLGPALRGEGEGLLCAIIDANKMSERIAMQRMGAEAEGVMEHPMPAGDDDEDYIDTGAAILSFYCTLVDLMGRCAPEAQLIAQGKNDSLRARAILRSLVPLEDLQGVLALRFSLSNGSDGGSDMPSGLVPSHKQSVVLFLERVYGMEDKELFFKLLEEAFLPDLRAATLLEKADGTESEMALALNRYIGNSILPALIKRSSFYAEAESNAPLLDATLHTVYRLSKCKILTKGQREMVSDFLVALTREMQPAMLLPLLRKLTIDVSKLSEYTTVALRLLTLHYERCGKYYGASAATPGTATEEEKRLTMMLFTNIFQSLSKMEYDPELFGKALPCLSAIGCALPPDYSLTMGYEDELYNTSSTAEGPYNPMPIDISAVELDQDITDLVHKFSEHYHDAWAARKQENGWTYGETWSDEEKKHPRLKPYGMLSDYECERYREPVSHALKALLALKWCIEYESSDGGAGRDMVHSSDSTDIYNYNPTPVDMTNLTLSRDMQNMADRLAENAHDIWAKKKKEELDASGGGVHPQMVPYDMLTEKEKRKDRLRSVELIKYLQFMGYNLSRGHGSNDDSGAAAALERRFAYSLLEKLIEYLDCAAINMKLLKPSNNFSRRSSYKTSTKDVKFFSKVVLPLMEKYFSTNRSYFLAVSTSTNMVGAASLKEKEMVATLFCKLANLMRLKIACFGSDTQVTVKCLQVMVRCIDAKTLTKNLPEFIRTSMLTFFNNAAFDLERCIQFLQESRYAYIRGTHLKTASSLNYVQMVLMPVLTSLFDHTAAYEFGQDLLLDEIQVACYKILAALYQLGTDLTLDKNRKFIKIALDRNRPAIGTCLGAFAATFPVAFLEPMMNKQNPFSIHNRIADQSLEAQEIIVKMETAIPSLEVILKEVEKFVDEAIPHDQSPHIIDILLPMLCSYLPNWWNVGPDNLNPSEGNHVSMVTCEPMNTLLRLVLRLIMNNVGVENAPWMTRIAGYTQQIIINSSEELLSEPYLPLAEKIRKRTEYMYGKEENLRGFLKSSTEDTSQVEGQLQEEWQILVRDIYAFYPLLIKYVDQQRNHWLKNNIVEAEDVYNHVSVIFHAWSNSQYFRREETNFISQNEIDNMTLIMPTASTRSRNAVLPEPTASSGGKVKKKKRARDKKRDKGKELASSLMVACLKRLLPVGLNLFAGREQELVQHCKEKFLAKVNETEILEFAKIQLTLPDKTDPSDAMNWQHTLYSQLGGGRTPRSQDAEDKKLEPAIDDTVERIVAMAKVLFGLHIIDHPQHEKQVWHSCVSIQRKRAVIACFRQTSLHMMPRSYRHRAVNLFLRTYREFWLSDENAGQEVVIEDLTQSFEDAESKKKEVEEEEDKPDQLTQLVTTFSRKATTESAGGHCEDQLYMNYAEIMAKSCGEEEEEGGDDEGDEGGDAAASINEQELEKQKLLFHQARLANRGVAEMVLLHISAAKGQQTDGVMKTLLLGISILRGGNIDVQAAMLNYLKEKKDAAFFLSISGLMSSCSVLDLDAFERNTKAEGLGVGADGAAGEKNMHDAEFTCALFRFIQLTCEGHNLDWQNYLRTQAGNTTTVNVINCTVDYLLRLQESIMDFYWHYSSKEIIDPAGKSNFFKAIEVASQVFNTLTEVIQGPCVGNQQTLAHSRLWDAVGGFLFLFAHMQDKLSKHTSQVDLLQELLNLQKDMVIMMLSMLEGNVVNGTIGKQMVDTLVENQSNVELILKYFDMFLKLKDLTSSVTFMELDINKDGKVTPREFREKMEQQKNYTIEEINFLLMCCDTNHDGKIDYVEFTERFHNPAKDIGFNLAVLLTNLSEHMPNDPRLTKFLETAGSVLNYFENFLGRIEIMGGCKRIERVYFEIKEDNIEQWEKPQIKESKRAFFYSIVTEGDKEKLEAFVNFCEDAIFEMQHAAALVEEEDDGMSKKSAHDAMQYLSDDEQEKTGMELIKFQLRRGFDFMKDGLSLLSPANVSRKIKELKQLPPSELAKGFVKMLLFAVYYSLIFGVQFIRKFWAGLMALMRGPPQEKIVEKEEKSGPLVPISMPVAEESPPDIPDVEAKSPVEESKQLALPEAPAEDAEGSEKSSGPKKDKKAVLSELLEADMEVSPEQALAAVIAAEKKEAEAAQVAAEESKATQEQATAAEPPPVSQVDFADYMHRVMSFMARNFYNLKYMALVLAFCINFLLLFYKATELGEDAAEDEVKEAAENVLGLGDDGLLDDSADAVLGGADDDSAAGSPALEEDDGGGEEEEEEDAEEWVHMDEKYFYMEHILRLCSVTHSIVAFFMLVAYYHLKIPLVIFKREKEVARRLEFDGLYIAEQPEDDDIKSHWDKLVISAKSFPCNYWDKFVKKKVRQKYSETYDFDSISNLLGMETTMTFKQVEEASGIIGYLMSVDWRYQVWKAGVTFTDNSFLYNLWYLSFSLLGNLNYFFFAAHLIDVAVAIPSLKTILQSVTHNGKQLLLTMMLLTIVVYCYTVIAFNFFRKFYVSEEDEEVDKKCHDMLTCFVFHLYKGVRAGGGIGDEIESPDGDEYEVYRILFDISFFFFIIVILLAIIQGLIIDAFGELRDQLESVKDNMESNCFICGMPSDYFDSVPHGFDVHVDKEHNLANYMFFLMHLINKDETEYTGQETYVWNMYQQRCWDFFPVGDCFRKQYEEELSGGGGG